MLAAILLAVAANGPMPPQAPCPPQAPVAAESRCPCSCGCKKADGRECDSGLVEPCKCRELGCQCYRGYFCSCDLYARAYEQAMREGKRLIVGVGQEPPAMEGVRIRVEEFPGIERGYVVGTPAADGGMVRKDHPLVDTTVESTNPSFLRRFVNQSATCVSG